MVTQSFANYFITFLGTGIVLTMKTENQGKLKDVKIIDAFRQMLSMYPDDTIDTAWEDIKDCSFEGYKIGRGGRHIFVIRDIDKVRIIIITKS